MRHNGRRLFLVDRCAPKSQGGYSQLTVAVHTYLQEHAGVAPASLDGYRRW